MINIIFFAKYRELAGSAGLSVDPAGIATVEALIRTLQARHPVLETIFTDQNLHIALNQRLTTPASPVKDGDEIAFFPPVTGG